MYIYIYIQINLYMRKHIKLLIDRTGPVNRFQKLNGHSISERLRLCIKNKGNLICYYIYNIIQPNLT